jgi:hypothetical protein
MRSKTTDEIRLGQLADMETRIRELETALAAVTNAVRSNENRALRAEAALAAAENEAQEWMETCAGVTAALAKAAAERDEALKIADRFLRTSEERDEAVELLRHPNSVKIRLLLARIGAGK